MLKIDAPMNKITLTYNYFKRRALIKELLVTAVLIVSGIQLKYVLAECSLIIMNHFS